MTPRPLRVAGVGYLNAAPLVFGLDRDPAIELFLGPPVEVSTRLLEDAADVALLPVAAAASIGDLELLDLGIASSGPVRSVVVASACPLEQVETLIVDASSRTSVVLARLELRARLAASGRLFPKLLSKPPAEAIASIGGTTAALVIGDPAIDLLDHYPHGIDLASAWKERTGLPFVFACWAARPGALDDAQRARLRRAAEEGLAARPQIAKAYAMAKGSDPDRYLSYLTDAIHYPLGAAEARGLQRFFDEGAAASLLPPVSPRALRSTTPEAAPRVTAEKLTTRKLRSVPPRPSVDTLLSRAADGGRLSYNEALRVYEEADLFELSLCADAIRQRKNGTSVVTYIVDRNVNYTNVCTTSCRFCAFYRPVGHAEGYVLSREQLGQKLQEVVDAGGVQILLQGGLNPSLRITWYEELFRWVKETYKLGLHALSPEEILHIAELEGLSVRDVLMRLHRAGLDSVPGGGAEILVDRVRRVIAKTKCTSDQWLGVMRAAHQLGLRSSGTMMYGTTDTAADRVAHLLKLRDLQDETGGFTAFFCWDFQYEKGTRIAPGDHGTVLYLRTQALARIVLDNFGHVGDSWVTQGPLVGQIALRFGADDWGSVMFEENVVSSAGTTFRMNAGTIEEQIHGAGYKAARRNVRYDHLTTPA